MEAILPIECEIPSLKLAVEILPKTSAEGESYTVPRIDVGQTHSGSLEGIPTIMCGSLHQGVSPLSRSSA
jgi:hypothetical protein